MEINNYYFLGIGEFSDKAIWRDPTISYIIPQVICKSCNHCRDIDLGRDQHRSESSWLCPLCNTAYDNVEIECFLLDTISKKVIAYNLQDLQCKKCLQVINTNNWLMIAVIFKFSGETRKFHKTLSLFFRFQMFNFKKWVYQTTKNFPGVIAKIPYECHQTSHGRDIFVNLTKLQ